VVSVLSRWLVLTGVTYLISVVVLVVSQAQLGSSLFFACVALACVAYLALLPVVLRAQDAPPRLLLLAFLFALAFRLPLSLAPVGANNDMVRYLWDGRIQRFGYNPYQVTPDNPSVAHTHTEQTRQMPSLRARTPYPPAAQLFFRLVVTIHESVRAMKLSLVACDILTIVLLWQWLVAIGRSPWLTLVYAWNPLVIIEVAHGGHIDALGALWIAASAYCLARRRTALASAALVLAIATKLLPVVLAPLYWRRIRWSDGLLGAALLFVLYLPFVYGGAPDSSAEPAAQQWNVPLGAVPNVVAHIRFNGPVFRFVRSLSSPQVAAAFAVLIGLAGAVWARRRLGASDPAAWAWPMALSLACSPVIYPWYLLYFTPFLWTRRAIPLVVWTMSVLPVYVVWQRSREGARWIVPWPIEALEFGLVLGAAVVLAVLARSRMRLGPPTTEELV
jgi:hypothetical protein